MSSTTTNNTISQTISDWFFGADPEPGDHVIGGIMEMSGAEGIALDNVDEKSATRCKTGEGYPVQSYRTIKGEKDMRNKGKDYFCTESPGLEQYYFYRNDSWFVSGIPNIPISGNPKSGYSLVEN